MLPLPAGSLAEGHRQENSDFINPRLLLPSIAQFTKDPQRQRTSVRLPEHFFLLLLLLIYHTSESGQSASLGSVLPGAVPKTLYTIPSDPKEPQECLGFPILFPASRAPLTSPLPTPPSGFSVLPRL